MNEIDPRIVKVSIEINGLLKTYEGLAISATGCKYANSNQNDCEIKIANMDTVTRNYILTETSPFNKNRTPKKIILEVGRKSTGTFQLFTGDITSVTPSPASSKTKGTNDNSDGANKGGGKGAAASSAQPPDITITIRALTSDYLKGDIISTSQAGQAKLSQISQQVANELGLSLNYQAKERTIANYSFTGGKLNQVKKLNDFGYIDAYVDDGTLVVKDVNVPLNGRVRKLDLSSGMIGIPEITEQGVKVKFLLDNQTTLGGSLEITSQLNPAANGTYTIYKLSFDLASRDTPFYFIAEGQRAGENG